MFSGRRRKGVSKIKDVGAGKLIASVKDAQDIVIGLFNSANRGKESSDPMANTRALL
jgi:hypothetical protein